MRNTVLYIMAVLGVLIIIPFAWFAIAAAEEFWNTWTYRYRLTLVVAADGQRHAGSGVIQIRVKRKSTLLPQTPGVVTSITGDAITVDLDARGKVFALLKDVDRQFVSSGMWHASPEEIVPSAFPPIKSEQGEKGLALTLKRYGEGGEIKALSADQLPLLVRFSDITEPRSIQQVDPKNLNEAYGADVKFVSATIETVPVGSLPFSHPGFVGPSWLTGVPVTRGIKEILPWLPVYRNKPIFETNGQTGKSYVHLVYYGDFIRE